MSTLLAPLSGSMSMLASTAITVGDHAKTTKLFGLTIDLDIVWATLIAAAVVLGLGFTMARKATAGVRASCSSSTRPWCSRSRT